MNFFNLKNKLIDKMCCFIQTDLKIKKLEVQEKPKQKQNVLKKSEEYIRKYQAYKHLGSMWITISC